MTDSNPTATMNSLGLSPLPSTRAEDPTGSFQMERDGFVDEALVSAMVSSPFQPSRPVPFHEDLALSADDMDFAGWSLSSSPAPRRAEVPPQVIDAIIRRAAPPVIHEPGLGISHQGSHRWWLAGVAGVLSTMLFSVLLISLSYRPGTPAEADSPSPLSSTRITTATPAPVTADAQELTGTPRATTR